MGEGEEEEGNKKSWIFVGKKVPKIKRKLGESSSTFLPPCFTCFAHVDQEWSSNPRDLSDLNKGVLRVLGSLLYG